MLAVFSRLENLPSSVITFLFNARLFFFSLVFSVPSTFYGQYLVYIFFFFSFNIHAYIC
uniref:Candidate secreted effector n=1 Tax=Meloidogyne incognita TaxID=6306 RepID=A0A914NVQ9_MELIC